MAKPVDYVLRLAAVSGRLEKEAILREAAVEGVEELFKGFRLAYDKRCIFGVKNVPLIDVNGLSDDELYAPSTFDWDEFEQLTHKLQTRQLTGNAARNALYEAANKANIIEWNHFYRPILIKDMRCGVTETTINNVLIDLGGSALEYLIKVWEVQLASDSKKHPKKLKGKKAIDPKLDGTRITTILDKKTNEVLMYTRNGNLNTNFTYIAQYLEKLLPIIPESIVLDGEMVSKSFSQLMQQVNRKKNVDTSDAFYALFDILTLEDFENGGTPMTQMERHNGLIELQPVLQEISNGRVYVIPKLIVDLDTDEGVEKMYEFYEETITAGYEGIMIKDVNAPYECKRGTHWLKWKPNDSIELTIVGYEEGTGRNKGRLGAFIGETTEDGKFVRVSVGSGYSDKMRDEYWVHRDEFIGEIMEVIFDPDPKTRFTKSQNSKHWSLRFPRFKIMRSINREGKI